MYRSDFESDRMSMENQFTKRERSRLLQSLSPIRIVARDCGTRSSIEKGEDCWLGGRRDAIDAIIERVSCETVIDVVSGKTIVSCNEIITETAAIRLHQMGIAQIAVRSPAHCEALGGICQLCYGADPMTGQLVELAANVGEQAAHWLSANVGTRKAFHHEVVYADPIEVTAATRGRVRFEDFDEPAGTQDQDLTAQHSQHVVASYQFPQRPRIVLVDDSGNPVACHFIPAGATIAIEQNSLVTAGNVLASRDPLIDLDTLPVHEGVQGVKRLLNARRPKDSCVLAPVSGTIGALRSSHNGRRRMLEIHSDPWGDLVEVRIPPRKLLKFLDGTRVQAGEPLTDGPCDPNDVLKCLGTIGVIKFLVGQLRRLNSEKVHTWCNQPAMDDRHFEVAIRQMLSNVQIEKPRDSQFSEGEIISADFYRSVNRRLPQSSIFDAGKSSSEKIRKFPAIALPILTGLFKP